MPKFSVPAFRYLHLASISFHYLHRVISTALTTCSHVRPPVNVPVRITQSSKVSENMDQLTSCLDSEETGPEAASLQPPTAAGAAGQTTLAPAKLPGRSGAGARQRGCYLGKRQLWRGGTTRCA